MLSDTLILPGSLEYNLAIQDLPPPPGWLEDARKTGGEMALVALPGSNGLLQAVSLDRAYEYIEDGELDARQEELTELEALEPDPVLWLPGNL